MSLPARETILSWIEAQRAELTARVASLSRQFDEIVEGSAWNRDDDEHDPEGATIAFERAQVADLLAMASHELTELDDAEARLDAGTYGSCQHCTKPIATERLAARPAATLCIDCANRRDRRR